MARYTITSRSATRIKTFNKTIEKAEKTEQKQLDRLMKKAFSCEHDALTQFEEFKKALKYSVFTEHTVDKSPEYTGRGAPKKGTEPMAMSIK